MSSTRPVRTYSRRHSTKTPDRTVSSKYNVKTGTSSSQLLDDEDDTYSNQPPRKRRLLDTSISEDEPEDTHTPMRKSSHNTVGPQQRAGYIHADPMAQTSYSGSVNEKSNRNKGRNNSVYNSERLPAVSREKTPSPRPRPPSVLSTPKGPKDLASVFELVSPQKTSRSKAEPLGRSYSQSGVKGRMLSRSKTESSIEALSPGPSGSQPDPKFHSAVALSRSVSESQLTEEETQSPSMSGSQRQREKANSNKTYAGKSRSFLVALPTASLKTGLDGSSAKQLVLNDDEDEYTRDSYSDLRKRYGVDNSENDALINAEDDSGRIEEGLALYNPLFSITDLRSKGESRRFLDEISYLFEGLDPSGSVSVRRSSAFDVVVKLCDLEFWKKAKASDLLTEIWDKLRIAGAGSGDKVLDCLLCCFIALASEDTRDISSLASKDDFVQTMIRLLETHSINDPFGGIPNDKLKLSKPEKLTLSRLRNTFSEKTSVVHDGCQPSARLLLSCTLSASPSLAFPHLPSILDSMTNDLLSISNRLAAFKSGLSLLPDTSQASHEKLCLEHIHNCLVILDSYLIEIETPDKPVLSREELLERYPILPSALINIITLADIVNRNDFLESLCSEADHCCELAFRVLINLTNGNKPWSETFTTTEYTLSTLIRLIMTSHETIMVLNVKKVVANAEDADYFLRAMDHLCLSLAFLTNLLQEGSNLVFLLHNTLYDTKCKGQRTCLSGCQCPNRSSSITNLIELYNILQKSEDDDMSSDLLFLRGHLSVLVGLLLLQLDRSGDIDEAEDIRKSIYSALPGPSGSWPRKLDKLLKNIEEFSSLFISMTSQLTKNERCDDGGDEEDENELENSMSQKAQLNASRANSSITVVAEVVTALKALRNTI